MGGVLLVGLALISPQTLSAGHGAMHLDLTAKLGIGALVFLIVTKSAASVISLGFGFRGGLFFASLYLGSLLGRLFAVLLDTYAGASLDPTGGLAGRHGRGGGRHRRRAAAPCRSWCCRPPATSASPPRR